MIKKYHTNLLSSFISSFLASLVFFILFLLLFEVVRILGLMSGQDQAIPFFLKLLMHMAMTLLPLAIPLSAYFGTVSTLTKFCRDAEIVSYRSLGLSYLKLFIPFLLISLFISLLVYTLSSHVVPRSHFEVRKMIKTLSTSSLTNGLNAGTFFNAIENLTIFSQDLSEEKSEMRHVFLNLYDATTDTTQIIFSSRGQIHNERDPKTSLELFELNLFEGSSIEFNQKDELTKTIFSSYSLPLKERKLKMGIKTKEIMLTNEEILQTIGQGEKSYKERGYKKKDFINLSFEYYNRLNQSFLPILFIFLGFTVAIRSYRSRQNSSQSKAIIYIIGYFVLYFTCVNLVKSGQMDAIFVALIPNSVFAISSIILFRKLNWQS